MRPRFRPEPAQVAKIRATWAAAAADPALATSLFYGRLFRQRPDLRALFKGDLTVQGRKLAETLNFVVDHLDGLDALDGPVRALGERHKGYGVSDEDYADVGAALIWAFQSLLGEDFDADAEEAWKAVYADIQQLMIDGRTAL